MNLLLRSLRHYRKESVLAPLLKMAEALLDLIVPLVMADIIDVGIAGHNRGYILGKCGLLVFIGAVGLAISITAQYFAARAAVGASTEIRHELFEHIGQLGYGELDHIGTGTLVTRMTSDVNQVQNAINLALRLLLRSPFIVFGAAVMAFRVNVRAAMIFVVTIPALAVVVFGIMRITRPKYRQVQEKLDRITGIVHENLTGVRVVRAFGRSRDETARFHREDENLRTAQEGVGRIAALMNPLTLVIVNLAIVAILQTGAVQVSVGTIAQGSVIALVNYMNQILVELVKLANLIVQISRGLACADRIDGILRMEPSMEYGAAQVEEAPRAAAADGAGLAAAAQGGGTGGAAAASAPAVEFAQVSFRYGASAADSLADISFTVNSGETVGVIGGTGSGKSSVAALIPRYYDVSEGAVRLFGRDVREYEQASVRGAVGMVPQKAQLFSGTIRSNLLWGNEHATDEELWAALDAAQAAGFVREKAGQLDAPVEQSGRNFSGGQKQRLTIARALVGHPRILILDDSSSALDYATDAALRRAIREMSGSMTIFIISQRTNSIMAADRIFVLDEGRLVGNGTHAELLKSCEVYRDIYMSQYKKEEGSGPESETVVRPKSPRAQSADVHEVQAQREAGERERKNEQSRDERKGGKA